MNPKILSEETISMSQVKEELKEIKKRDKELNFNANKTFEYLNEFALLKNEDSEKITKEISKLEVPRLKDMHIYKIVDLMPDSVEELRVILQGYTITISKENMQSIVEVLKKYKEKAK
jgi:DNA-directed RNA polymerase subunit F